MTSLWKQWVTFWSEQESPKAIAGFRICMGLTLLYTFGAPYFSSTWIPIWVDASEGGVRYYNKVPWLLDLMGGATQQGVEMLIVCALLASVALTIGIGARWASLFGMLAMNTVSWHNPMASGGHDDLIANGLWILFFVPSDTTWSVSSKLKSGKWTCDNLIPSFARRLLLFQLIVMYCSTGLQKVSAHWIPFGSMDALWYILQQPTWAKQNFEWLAPWFSLTQLATLGTWLFEVFSPLLLIALYCKNPKRYSSMPSWIQRTLQIPFLTLFVVGGVGMHIGIWLTMDVGPFSFAAISYYWTLLPTKVLEERHPPSTNRQTSSTLE